SPLRHLRTSFNAFLLQNLWPDKDRPPNFVLIMVDDLGIGDIGCYGNDTIRTPHIDRLASEGVRLTQHLAAAPLCTPSRAAFLTGRYALRSGLGSSGRVQVLLFLGGSGGLPPSETTFAKRLQQQGYTTGLVGKWHLGVSCESRGDHCHHPNHHGFSFFYGLPFTLFNDCVPGHGSDILNDLQTTLRSITLLLGLGLATLLLARWNCVLMRDGQVVEQPLRVETLSQRLLQEAQGFVHRNKDRPFLLFFSLAHIHTPLFTNPQFMGKSRHGLYGDNLEEVDWIVGQITETVDSLGLSNSTLMYFTSDHGDTWRTGTRRGRREAGTGFIKAMGGWEGGIRVPGYSDGPADSPGPRGARAHQPLDGHNLMPLLEGTAQRSGHEFMFHYCGVNLNAVRWHPPGSESIFKAHLFTPNFSPEGAVGCYRTGVCMCHGEHVTHHNPPLLYDLHHDPSESRPLTPELEPRYHEALREVGAVHSDGPSGQLSWGQILWRPWLQPCCGTFPLCGCKEQSAQ
uniref:Arylsulfatase D n=1 Tax=Neogobius melanostomus TaxID=47308 RepID=A0A8C6S5D0_9GOBI